MHTYQPCPECRKINRISLESLIQARKQPQCGSCKSPIFMTGVVGELNASGLMALVEKCPMPIVAMFWAPKTQGSDESASTYFEAAEYFGQIAVFVRINAVEHRLAPDAYQVRGIPTTLVFWDGFERARMAQPLPPQAFLGWLQQVLLKAASPKEGKTSGT